MGTLSSAGFALGRPSGSRLGVWRVALGAVLIIAGGALLAPLQAPRASLLHPQAAPLAPASRYGQRPLSLEPNTGQADPAVRFPARGGGYALFLAATSSPTAADDATRTPTPTPTFTSTPTETRTPTVTPTPRPPSVESIDPASAGQGANVAVTVYGDYFQPGAVVTIGDRTLRQVEYLGAEATLPHRWRLKGTLPGGLAPGSYDVQVANPDGQAGELRNGLTVRSDYTRGLGPATVSYGAYTWANVGSHNYPSLAVCAQSASISTDAPLYGDPPASVVLVNGEGTALSALTRVSEIVGGGLYRGTASIGRVGGPWAESVRIVVAWADGQVMNETVLAVRFTCADPNGRIDDATTSAPIADALVTLMERGHGSDRIWAAAPSGHLNPQSTNAQGRYAWHTPAGTYTVRVCKPCYADAESPVYSVLPPVEGQPLPVTGPEVGLTPRECSSVSVDSAQATDAQGRPLDLLAPGAPLRLLARVHNAGAAALGVQAATTVDYRLELLDPRSRTCPGLWLYGSVSLTPGENTLELSGVAPPDAGEYTLVAWVTYDQQTTFRAFRFRVGGGERAQLRTYLPFVPPDRYR